MTTAATTADATPAPRRRRRRRALAVGAALFIILAAWVAYDLYAPRRTTLRDFDPDEVARLETEMWRSYYSRQRVRLFTQMSELLRTQYRLPLWRSNAVAYQAAKAAFVFKDGHSRADYERALPNLVSFYTSIREVTEEDWKRIDELLHQSWRSLHRAVNS